MSSPSINIVVAAGKRNEIGKRGQLIWRISDDLKRFKQLTMGGVLIMGRKTYQSIGRPLPGRINIVVTRQEDFPDEGIFIARSPAEALEKARCFQKPVFIIGGEQIYRALLPHTERIYLTRIEATDDKADAFFPEFQEENWHTVEKSPFFTTPSGLKFSYLTLEKSPYSEKS